MIGGISLWKKEEERGYVVRWSYFWNEGGVCF